MSNPLDDPNLIPMKVMCNTDAFKWEVSNEVSIDTYKEQRRVHIEYNGCGEIWIQF